MYRYSLYLTKEDSMRFSDILKTIILLLIFVNIAPPLWNNFTTQWMQDIEPKTKVGYIDITDLSSSDQYTTHLRNYFKNPDIKAVFLHIESDGGATGTSQAIVYEIQNLKTKYPKPVIAYSENICASGGYYIACAADHIIAPGGCIIGSIGSAFVSQFNVKKLLTSYNVDCTTISSGTYKTVFSNLEEITDPQKKMLQTICDDTYQQFITFVAAQRHMQISNAQEWADGKIFSGQQAKQLHLIDTIGSKLDAIEFLKKSLIPSDKNIEWVYPPKSSWWNSLTSFSDESESIMGYQTTKNPSYKELLVLFNLLKKHPTTVLE